MKRLGFLVTASCLVSSLAAAQPGPDSTDPGAPPPAPVAAPPAPAAAPPPAPAPPPPSTPSDPNAPDPAHPHTDLGTLEDANAGRAWLTPTALTEPAGTYSFTDYELLVASLGYSFTDQFSVSATTLLPVVDGTPFFLLVSAKYQLLRQGRVRLAAQGAITIAHDDDTATAGILGGALTICIDDACRSNLNGYVGAGFANESNSAVPLAFAGSLTLGLSRHVKVVGEIDSAYVAGGGINEAANGFLAWYGLRFTSRDIGVDLGFAKPICTSGCDDSSDPLPLGLPFLSFTYRGIK